MPTSPRLAACCATAEPSTSWQLLGCEVVWSTANPPTATALTASNQRNMPAGTGKRGSERDLEEVVGVRGCQRHKAEVMAAGAHMEVIEEDQNIPYWEEHGEIDPSQFLDDNFHCPQVISR